MLSDKEHGKRVREQSKKSSAKHYKKNREKILRKQKEKRDQNPEETKKYFRQLRRKREQKLYNRGYKDGIFQTALLSGIVLVSVVAIWLSSNHLLSQKLDYQENRTEFWLKKYINKGVK